MMILKNSLLSVTVLFAVLLCGTSARAQSVPQQINYQGRLTDNTPQQTPVDGVVPMQFEIWDAAAGGIRLWREPDADDTGENVIVSGGIFNVLLGQGNPLPATVFATGGGRYLQIILNPRTVPEPMQPRQQVGSTAFAALAQAAGDSNQLGGVSAGQYQLRTAPATCPAGQYMDALNVNGSPSCRPDLSGVTAVIATQGLSGSISAGTLNLSTDVTVQRRNVAPTCPAGEYLQSVAANGAPTCSPDAGVSVPMTLSGNLATPIFSSTNNGSGSGVQGTATTGTGVQGNSTSGVAVRGDSNSSGAAVLGFSNSNTGTGVSGNTMGGGTGVSGSATVGTGVNGTATTTGTGVQGTANAVGGTGVHGTAAFGTAVKGTTVSGIAVDGFSSSGTAIQGYSNSNTGTGVSGNTLGGGTGVSGSATSGYGMSGSATTGIGIKGISTSGFAVRGDSSSGTAILGYSNSNTGTGVSGGTLGGGRGVSGSAGSGTGVEGTATSGTGVSGTSGGTGLGNPGVYGESTAVTGFTYAVYGLAQSTTGRGVYGHATAITGATNGVVGEADSPAGAGVRAIGSSADDGTALQVENGRVRAVGAGVNSHTFAFIHATAAANTIGDTTCINNTMLNGHPEAIVVVVPVNTAYATSNLLAHNFPWNLLFSPQQAAWTDNKWCIMRQDTAPDGIPTGKRWHVLAFFP